MSEVPLQLRCLNVWFEIRPDELLGLTYLRVEYSQRGEPTQLRISSLWGATRLTFEDYKAHVVIDTRLNQMLEDMAKAYDAMFSSG